MAEGYPRKYWWVVLVVVPLVAGVVAVLPSLTGGGGDSGGEAGNRITIEGSSVAGDVQIMGTQVILQQAGADGGEVDDPELSDKLERAVNLVKGGLYDEATRLFEEVAGTVGTPAVYNNLGTLYLLQARLDEAQAALREGIARDPGDQPLHLGSARVYQQQGDEAAAIAQLARAPDEPAAARLLETLESRAAAGVVERAPNGEILSPNALPLGEAVVASISDPRDVDFFLFDAPPLPRDVLAVHVRNRSTGLQPHGLCGTRTRATSGATPPTATR